MVFLLYSCVVHWWFVSGGACSDYLTAGFGSLWIRSNVCDTRQIAHLALKHRVLLVHPAEVKIIGAIQHGILMIICSSTTTKTRGASNLFRLLMIFLLQFVQYLVLFYAAASFDAAFAPIRDIAYIWHIVSEIDVHGVMQVVWAPYIWTPLLTYFRWHLRQIWFSPWYNFSFLLLIRRYIWSLTISVKVPLSGGLVVLLLLGFVLAVLILV